MDLCPIHSHLPWDIIFNDYQKKFNEISWQMNNNIMKNIKTLNISDKQLQLKNNNFTSIIMK